MYSAFVSPPTDPQAADQRLQMFWQHQWARIRDLEGQRTLATTFVFAATALLISAAAERDWFDGGSGQVLVGLALALLNVLAIAYLLRCTQLIGIHKARANTIIDSWPEIKAVRESSLRGEVSRIGRLQIHLLVHVLLIVVSVIFTFG